MKISEFIKVKRNENGISAKDLADKLGISCVQLRFYEYDRRFPSMKVLKKMADIFETDYSDLLLMTAESKSQKAN